MTISVFTKRILGVSAGLLLGASLLGQAVAGEQLQTIKDKGVINIGLEGTYPPFSFVDADGKLTGFEVELSEALAKELGVKAKVQPTKWDGILAALESKRLDVVVNQVTISDERKKKYDFSKPYTISGIQALILKKNAESLNIKQAADLAGKKVGVGLGTNYEQWVKKEVPQADVRTYEDDPSKFADLRNGRINAILWTAWPLSNTPRKPRTPRSPAMPSPAWNRVSPCAKASRNCSTQSTRRWTSCALTAPSPSCRRNTSVPT